MVDFVDVLSYGSSEAKSSIASNPPVGFHFMVSFLIAGFVPNPLDIRFQKVSGISSEIETTEIREGGENVYQQCLPTRVTYDNLILERGMVIGSILNAEFNLAMTTLSFIPSNVLVILLDEKVGEKDIPVAAWAFHRAYPVKWTVSDLDANENAVVIETMELAYTRFQNVRI